MKIINKTQATSFIVGLLVTIGSFAYLTQSGDYLYRGFPVGYSDSLLGITSSLSFSLQLFVLDFAYWSSLCFVLMRLDSIFRKKDITIVGSKKIRVVIYNIVLLVALGAFAVRVCIINNEATQYVTNVEQAQ